MTARRGIVLAGSGALDEALGLYLGAPFVFLDALEVRAMSFAVSVKRLATIGRLAIGAALVDGKIVAAIDIADSGESAQGLLLTAEGRHDVVMLLGATVLDVGSFATVGSQSVAFRGAEAVVASVERLFSELEGHTWSLRQVYGASDGQSPSARRERSPQ